MGAHDFSFINDIRVLALKAVLDPSVGDYLRSVYRAYSQKFHTPLHEVEKLPLLYVLQEHYESQFEDMEQAERLHFGKELITTPEEKAAKALEEETMIETMMREEEIKRLNRAKRGTVKKDDSFKSIESDSLKAVESLKAMANGLEIAAKALAPKVAENREIRFDDSDDPDLDLPSIPTERKPVR